ncbi:lipopolysaccharide-induced tumor necrosis factor-alpha factor homolog [Phymastichus coffea]|uniref:lipopolysaccharide-induced tumor necrosis factor-alpha factor homolog n=1 Tax=Phymastichus coffea TaxID=108790 RepID=UPI00273CDDA1|nr:lipopolysaccharide-induced tumor necrosis factor-alpha factor homolog [Phymastichus coffea]
MPTSSDSTISAMNQKKTPMPTAPDQPSQATNVLYTMLPQPQVGPDPVVTTCPHCNTTITSRVEKRTSMKTHLFFILLCALGCCCCAPFVYCTSSCLAKKHTCPTCNYLLGVYDK